MTKRKAYTVRMVSKTFEHLKKNAEKREGYSMEQQEFIEQAIHIYGRKERLLERLTTKGKLKIAYNEINRLKYENQRLHQACITPDATLMQAQRDLQQAVARVKDLEQYILELKHDKACLEQKYQQIVELADLFENQVNWCLEQLRVFDGKSIRVLSKELGIKGLDSKIQVHFNNMPK